jgi:metallo-beta-lactamase family protein
MLGVEVPVRADIRASDAYSAHADRDEILRWLRQFQRPPEMTYVVHAERPGADALRDAIATDLGWKVAVAEDGQRVAL